MGNATILNCYKQGKVIFLGFFVALTGGCSSDEPLPTIAELDVERYMGKWYEIARLPNRFEENLECVTATYTLKSNGKVDVLNKGIDTADNNTPSEANGTARMPDKDVPGQLKVVFFWPFGGDYYIIELDENYTHALVGSPDRDYLWILSRTPTITQDVKQQLLESATRNGFNVDLLHYTKQDLPDCG